MMKSPLRKGGKKRGGQHKLSDKNVFISARKEPAEAGIDGWHICKEE